MITILLTFLALAGFAYQQKTIIEISRYLPATFGVDWVSSYYPAIQRLFSGSPVYGGNFYNPPWVLFILAPLGLLSARAGAALIFALNVCAFVLVFVRLRVPCWALPILLFLGPIATAQAGNIDGLCALGFLLPPQIGLFFILTKPQIGIGLALFWAVDAWVEGRFIKTFSPVIIAYLLSFAVFGWWMGGAIDKPWNVSIFPWGLLIGLPMLAWAILSNRVGWAIAAGPLLSPYITGPGWGFVPLGIISMVAKSKKVLY